MIDRLFFGFVCTFVVFIFGYVPWLRAQNTSSSGDITATPIAVPTTPLVKLHTTENSTLYRFEDGENICYFAEKYTGVAIECVQKPWYGSKIWVNATGTDTVSSTTGKVDYFSGAKPNPAPAGTFAYVCEGTECFYRVVQGDGKTVEINRDGTPRKKKGLK